MKTFRHFFIDNWYCIVLSAILYYKMNKITEVLRRLFLNGISSVNPSNIIQKNLILKDNILFINNKEYVIQPEKCYIIGFGKAVIEMARAAENILRDYVTTGIVITPEASSCESENSVIQVYEGGKNNLIDENSVNATNEIIKLVEPLTESDLVLVMVSGGGSALLAKPKTGISIADKLDTTKLMQKVGANIRELNCVRSQLSQVKGGRLADIIYPAKTIGLILSDIVGDPLEYISSGPTVKPTEKCEVMEIIRKYRLEKKIPQHIISCIAKDEKKETNAIVDNFIIGNNTIALESMKSTAIDLKYPTIVMSNFIEGDVEFIAKKYSKLACLACKYMYRTMSPKDLELALKTALTGLPLREDQILELKELLESGAKKLCLLFGGETTIEVKGNGSGGRNQALALYFSVLIDRLKKKNVILQEFDVALLAGGSDGIDGPTDAAGAVAYIGQTELAAQQGLNPQEFISQSDSYNYYTQLNNSEDIIKIGHTGTNVMDFHILIIQPKNMVHFSL